MSAGMNAAGVDGHPAGASFHESNFAEGLLALARLRPEKLWAMVSKRWAGAAPSGTAQAQAVQIRICAVTQQ